MSDTLFSSSPHRGAYIALYNFLGGIAGGSFFLAGLLHLFGRAEDRPAIRAGYYVALAGAVLSGLLLTLDLSKPFRFWHMLLQSNRGVPMFKPWSPMSVGAWALLGFAVLALLASLGALGETRGWRRAAGLGRGAPGVLLAVLGGLLGLFLAGYTGVLLAVTNRPVWADSSWLGAVFLASGVSTAAATLILLGRGTASADGTGRWLAGFDRGVLAIELVTLVAFMASLGAMARLWLGWTGAVLLLGVVGTGIVAPLALEGGRDASRRRALAAVLVLLGGLLLRVAVIASAGQASIHGSRVAGP
jgi:protein NrfD